MADLVLTGKRVLVVEDEMLVLMAIEDVLLDLGCTSITTAGNLAKALELAKTGTFDLATLDLNLGGERSDAIATALSERGVPFAFSTGYGEHGVGALHGHRPILNKPYSSAHMVAVLTALVAEAAAA